MRRHLPLLLSFATLATSCLDLDFSPPLPPPPPNDAVVFIEPSARTACETITWTLAFHRGGQDVTNEAWYRLSRRPDLPVKVPTFTLGVHPEDQRAPGVAVQPVTAQGVPISNPEFGDTVTHVFTCTPTGETAGITVHRSTVGKGPETAYPAVYVTYEHGTLVAR